MSEIKAKWTLLERLALRGIGCVSVKQHPITKKEGDYYTIKEGGIVKVFNKSDDVAYVSVYKETRKVREKQIKKLPSNLAQFEGNTTTSYGSAIITVKDVIAELMKDNKTLWLVPKSGAYNWSKILKAIKQTFGTIRVKKHEMDAVSVKLPRQSDRIEIENIITANI